MKCDKKNLLLYAVTDRHWLDGRKLIDVVRESLDGGVTMLQLREKALAEEKFLEEARELQALCRERHVPFIVNDNVDIAKAMDADGVHVGQDDMEALDVRAKLGRTRSSAFPPIRWRKPCWQRSTGRTIWAWARYSPPAPRTMWTYCPMRR